MLKSLDVAEQLKQPNWESQNRLARAKTRDGKKDVEDDLDTAFMPHRSDEDKPRS